MASFELKTKDAVTVRPDAGSLAAEANVAVMLGNLIGQSSHEPVEEIIREISRRVGSSGHVPLLQHDRQALRHDPTHWIPGHRTERRYDITVLLLLKLTCERMGSSLAYPQVEPQRRLGSAEIHTDRDR